MVFRSVVSWWPSDLALTELCLALPFGSLTAVVGDVGSGEFSEAPALKSNLMAPVILG